LQLPDSEEDYISHKKAKVAIKSEPGLPERLTLLQEVPFLPQVTASRDNSASNNQITRTSPNLISGHAAEGEESDTWIHPSRRMALVKAEDMPMTDNPDFPLGTSDSEMISIEQYIKLHESSAPPMACLAVGITLHR
jgi:hypothetical protein